MPFLRYVYARYEERQREEAYRICVTDSLRILTENTAEIVGGKMFTVRYFDLTHPRKEETRTAGEVIEHIRNGLRRL